MENGTKKAMLMISLFWISLGIGIGLLFTKPLEMILIIGAILSFGAVLCIIVYFITKAIEKLISLLFVS
jgi:hypothetical protein